MYQLQPCDAVCGGLYNLLYVYLYLQYIHVYIYICNMTGIMYQLYDMCVLLMLFSVCFGVTMFGEPWLRPPALWNQLRATRPGPAARKIIMKPMISKLSMAFGHKKKHNPNNLTRKHKENNYNWQFQLISMGGIEKTHYLQMFPSGTTGGKAQNLPQWPMPMQSWVVGFITWHLGGRIFPPILVVKSNGNLPKNARNHSGYSGFSGNRAVTAGRFSRIFSDDPRYCCG